MRGKWRIVQLLASIAILVWIYTRVPVGDVVATVRAARPSWLVAGAAFVILLQLLATLRWRVLVIASGLPGPLVKLLGFQLASVFYKLFIPGGMLASIGVRYVKLHGLGGSRVSAFSSVVVDRLVATLGLALVGACAWLVDEPLVPAAVGWIVAAWLALVAGLLVVVLHGRAARAARSLAATKRLTPVTTRVAKLAEAFSTFRTIDRRAFGALTVLTLLPHIAGLCAYWALARAVDVEVPLIAWAWLRAAVTLVTSQPLSLAGLGARDASVAWLLSFYGVEEERALAVAFLLLGGAVLTPGLLGGLLEARTFWRIKRVR